MYSIYIRENKINKKKYVGVTMRTLEERAGKDGCFYIYGTPNTPFAKAIKKYGWDNFDSYIVCQVNEKEEAYKIEKYFILKYKTADLQYGYNTIIDKFSEVSSHKGSRNGMYGNGYKLAGDKNGRAKNVTIKFPNGDIKDFTTQNDAREYLGISKDMFISIKKYDGPFEFSKMTNKYKIERNKFLRGVEVIIH